MTSSPSASAVIGHEDSAISGRAALATTGRAQVAHVFEPKAAFELAQSAIPPAPFAVRAVPAVDDVLAEGAQKLGQQGAGAAQKLGFDSEALTVADLRTVAATSVPLAREHDAPACVALKNTAST